MFCLCVASRREERLYSTEKSIPLEELWLGTRRISIFPPPPPTQTKTILYKNAKMEIEHSLDIIRIFHGCRDHQSVLNVSQRDFYDFSQVSFQATLFLKNFT